MRRSRWTLTLTERFWSKVDQSGGLFGCWPWTGGRNGQGYGVFYAVDRLRSATHVALELAGRPLAAGQDALHSCDNPPCVNPAHLWGGTVTDNLLDASQKGRLQRGEDRPTAKLTESGVRDIRVRLSRGESRQQMADMFGVSLAAIRKVAVGETWKHVGES